ncbi:transglycosylase SLT domain-containing protein, partial [Brevundimonas sp.]|uniref:transglycosylase SLT domain-containing protein n=1 Tax=Brevundimonas sp. TaxID=1871086 RepID=UPI002C4AE6FA
SLLALVLSRSGADPDGLAGKLLARFGSLGAVAAADLSELTRSSDAGPAIFADLKILRELAVRLARVDACRRPAIASWTALQTYVRTAMAHRPREQFRVLYLDHRNNLLRDEWVAEESAYRVDAISPAGAGGLTQLMPGTATDLGVRDRFDVEQNLSGGADYLARQMLRFGDVRLALAAYNAGPGRVARLGRVPDIAETRAYVISVVDCYLALTAGRSARSARECRPPEAVL